MRIAIPVIGDRLSSHFGRSDSFAIVDMDPAGKEVLGREELPAPAQGHVMLARWLLERGTDMIVVGGIGRRALDKFDKCNIEVRRIASPMTPDEIIQSLINGTLPPGEMTCEHGDGDCGDNNARRKIVPLG